MSWLNLNDSLNSLKGQLSNFANNVLADDDPSKDGDTSQSDLEKIQEICSQQQEEINYLKKVNAELRQGDSAAVFPQNDANQTSENWSWEVSDADNPESEKSKTQKIIADLKKTISDLENEKQELVSSLDLLDSEHQLNTEKLINLKDKLQENYNELEDKYIALKKNNESLVESRKQIKNQLDDLKSKHEKSVPTEESACNKCESLLKENQKYVSDLETLRNEIAVLKSNNATLQKVLDDSKSANDEQLTKLEENLKLCESENKILVMELKKATQSMAEFERKSEIDKENFKKLANILEGYEQQVSSLKDQLSKKETTEDTEKVKSELEEELKRVILAKEQTHTKYVNILTENMKKYADCDKPLQEVSNSASDDDPQVSEFSHQVESILNILLDLKCKCDNLEKELFNVTQEKTNMLSEKNHEIEKLMQNSEILSQEVIRKSQTIKDYESECSELLKNNDMLINELEMYKNSSGLQTISESNEDNILLLESQLENANKKIEELEKIISDMEKAEEPSEETEEGKVTKASYEELLRDYDELKKTNNLLKNELETLQQSNISINDENQKLNSMFEKVKSDLENAEYQYIEMNVNTESLREEIDSYKKKNEELIEQKLSLEKQNVEYERNNEDIRSEFNVIKEKFLLEEDARKQLESQVRSLTEKLQNAKMSETSLKLQYDTVSKELLGLSEAKQMAEAKLQNCLENFNQCQSDLVKYQEEIEKLKKEHKEDPTFEEVNIENNSTLLEKTNLELEEKLSSISEEHSNCRQNIAELEQKIEELSATKNELTNVIITKHQENVTYHNEIQRLSQVLTTEMDKNRNLEALLQSLNSTENQKQNEEIEKLTDQNNFLRQKCEVLAENLLQEQSKVQQMLAEQNSPSEREQGLAKKLERLQSHLIEVEEHYTQELLRAEERNTELQAKVNEIEQREKNSSTMYTSVSIRANQHVETLQHQLQLITNQRDELRRKISDAEDHASKQEAALANLQFVLEQFQKEKENDVEKETERIRRQIQAEKRVQDDLRGEISNLQSQLEESKQGLLAASRISDQLEQSKHLISNLKSEVSQLKEKLQKSEDQIKALSSQTDGKVDKSLIKNLVIGFVSTNNNLTKDQTQILKIIATVLDFSQQDHDKLNLNKPQQGWLSSLLAPQTSQGMTQESLSQAFVKFLENESKPRLVPSLLSNNGEAPKSRKNSVTVPRQSPSILSEVVLPTFADFAQNRNSSSILKDVLKDNS
ncbi:thyroid receptor-interacting protein 11 [Tribolium castaneum]|uniref:GRIP domain-containing protein n=1 Tax=Tribolium castaneum TaxID=7070 RepID=D6WF75_TRICA|nr:PREDICTED: thyroid receptor-interacting protein 11 [Tribolium castaneum]EEZ99827.1 hypothetical protein TcasGA2_TC002608 [Tribolium castaneum]|eukprot:XP_967067.1 PREDICTED: thyroid receptor-interacting protein 11 [Tribolium castaneum]